MSDARPQDPFVWYGLAMEYRALGHKDDAEKTFHHLLKQFPDYVPAYHMAGQFFAELGKPDDARFVLRSGIEVAARVKNVHAQAEMQALVESLG